MLWLGERRQGAGQSLSQPCPSWENLLNNLCERSPGQCQAPSGPTSSHLAQADVLCVTLEPRGPPVAEKRPGPSSEPV